MKLNIRAAVTWIAVLLTFGGAAAEDNYVDRIVAVVDNEIILESELQQYIQFTAGSQAALEKMSQTQIDSLRRGVLEELIRQKVLLAKARADTMQVEARVVDAELDGRVKALIDQAGGQERLEDYYGMPLARIKRQFRALVEEGMLIEKVRQAKLKDVAVTPSDVQRFWEMYRDSMPELKDAVRIAHILLQDSLSESSIESAIAKADSVRKLLLAGDLTFEGYAMAYSEDPGSASKGGILGTTNRGELVPRYEAAAYGLEEDEISEPVVSEFGVHLIRLNERIGEKINTSHILFKIVPTDHDREVTRARADSIVQALRGGADCGELALRYSRDLKTAGKGGDLGWFAPEELPDDFRAPVTGLKKSEITEPIRTRFGLHVLKVTDRTFARKITLEEDYERVKRMSLAKKQDEMYSKWVDELAQDTYIERK
ncbi:peptidylprolyl isomerase [bacterium]|nr:peptidylprolyl isomerase [bacterium]